MSELTLWVRLEMVGKDLNSEVRTVRACSKHQDTHPMAVVPYEFELE